MLRKIIKAFLLLSFVAACTEAPKNNYVFKEVDLDLADRDSSEFWDFYTDVKFIPLENSLKGMVYYAPKMVVADDVFYVLDRNESGAEVKKFDTDGHYLCSIGRLGHAKGEYQDLLDFAVSESGDTVVLLTRTSLMAYDSNGKYLFSENQLNDGSLRKMQGVKGGYLCTAEYSGAAHMLHRLDGKMRDVSESLPTNDVIIGVPSIADNPIQQGDGFTYYYDSYTSTLYQMDEGNAGVRQAVCFSSKYALTAERFSDENVYDGNMDHVCEYLVDGSVAVGHVRLTEPSYGTPLFVYDVSTGKMSLHDSKYYSPRLASVCNGYHYALIAQDEFLEMRQVMKQYEKSDAFNSNYFDVAGSVDEKSNYVLMVARPRKSYEK